MLLLTLFIICFSLNPKIFCTFAVQMRSYSLNINGRLFDLGTPKVMAVVNATTDSFAFSCTNISEAEILSMTAQAIAQVADIIDVGGCSTRPGAQPVTAEEEWRRIDIALRAIRRTYPDAVLSVDTFRADIARKAVERYHADIINDVSGGSDPNMFSIVAELAVPYVLTYASPLASDKPVSVQVLEFLVRKADELHRLGVRDVIADPGFGFNKSEEQNYELLKYLNDLCYADLPILVGISRKSMFYKPLQTTPDSDMALTATIAANAMALKNGANILRVHDVAAAKTTIDIIRRII